MIEMKNTKETKSMLAKLLASENLTVEHGKFQTASFDVKNRVLRLPIWKEMSGSLYDLLVLHEVGHALYTPEEGYHDAKGHGKGFKSFLNVVEDARIERKIKNKFPGGRRAFVEGYTDLMNRDFFGIKEHGLDVNEMNLIDRINLHYKAASRLDIEFNSEESVFVSRIDKAETWKEVVKICVDLYEYSRENESETDMSDHSGMSEFGEDDSDDYEEENLEGNDDSMEWNSDMDKLMDEMRSQDSEGDESDEEESDSEASDSSDSDCDKGKEASSGSESDESEENKEESSSSSSSGMKGGDSGRFDPDWEPESLTDENFRSKEMDLLDEKAINYRYVDLPTNIPLNSVIVDYKDILEEFVSHYSDREGETEVGEESFKSFRDKNKKVVEYLAKEFEMKKAAKDHKRAATANSGILSSEKLYTYKYNEHLFKKLTVTPDGKNHGLVLFVDWSGSMGHNMKGTIEQMLTLVMFCKRVNIPFEVYAFSDSYFRKKAQDDGEPDYKNTEMVWNGIFKTKGIPKSGEVAIRSFSLLNFFSSRMKAQELKKAYNYMSGIAEAYRSRYDYYSYGSRISVPNNFSLGGTPLDATLLMGFSVMRDFIKRNQVDVINSIFLTDGDSNQSGEYWTPVPEDKTTIREYVYGKGEYVDLPYSGYHGMETTNFDRSNERIILRDPVSGKSRKMGAHRRRGMTMELVKMMTEVFNINIVNFFIVPKIKRWDMSRYLDEIDEAAGKPHANDWERVEKSLREWRKNKYFIAPGLMGFSDTYLMLGGKALEVQESSLDVDTEATKAQMTRAFKKFNKGKLENRRMLSRFVGMVAA